MGDGTTNAVTCWEKPSMFTQILDPTGNLFVTWLVALVPVVLLLFLLAILRLSAWLATLIGSIVTLLLGLCVCALRAVWRPRAARRISTALPRGCGTSTGSRFGA